MKRRQQFITPAYYAKLVAFYDSAKDFWNAIRLEEDSPGQEASLRAKEIQMAAFKGLMIRYTAGEPIASLIPHLEKLVSCYEAYQRELELYSGSAGISPLNIEKLLFEYEEFVQVVSWCVLLNRRDLAARFVKLTDDAGFSGEDILYEDLLKKVLPNRFEVNGYYHESYVPLIEAIYADTPEEASRYLEEYCKSWYPSFEKAQTYWHDTHLIMTEDDGSYFGYWALEAAAIAFLYNIDDSAISHMVYPKDLVEYARGAISRGERNTPEKTYAGQPCPTAGYWFTPAKSDSLRFFKQGEVMPEFKGSSWGATIWYWSGDEE